MANKYFNWQSSLKRFVRFDAARSEDMNDALDQVSVGLDSVETDTKRAIKLPASGTDQLLNLTPGQRANLLLGFDPSGSVTAVPGGGRFAGDWVAGAAYLVSDTFRDPATKNIYSTVTGHTSTTIAADLAAGKIRLAVNVVDVEAAKADSQSARDRSQEWANKTGANVDGTEFSAKEYATGSAVPTGSAKKWATQTGSPVDGTEFSAKEYAGNSKQSAEKAAASEAVVTSVANFKGAWSSLAGALSRPATVLHNGKFWVLLNNLANVALSQPGVSADWTKISSGAEVYAYDNRAALRTLTAAQNDQVIVDGLGLFVFFEGSTEPDDDESCFATANGRWLMEAAHWDVVDSWQLPDAEARDDGIQDLEARSTSLEARFPGRLLHGTATSSITSVGATAAASFTATVAGAKVGDLAIATPPAALDVRLAVYARVTAADTVTVTLNNASASATSVTSAGSWTLAVISAT